MSRAKSDPVERALDAYFALDEVGKKIYDGVRRYREQNANQVEIPLEKRRGRPVGSRNKGSAPPIVAPQEVAS